jgi:hypothetical protein
MLLMLLHKHFAQRLLYLSEIPKSQHCLLREKLLLLQLQLKVLRVATTITQSAGL